MSNFHFAESSSRDSAVRLRKEKGELYHPRNMDLDHDRGLLRRPIHGSYLYYPHHHCHPDYLIQGSHRHLKRPN